MAKAKTKPALEAVPMDTPISRAALEIRPVALINPTDFPECWFVRSLSFNGWTLLPVENHAGLYKAIPDVLLTPDPAVLEVCMDSDAWEFLFSNAASARAAIPGSITADDRKFLKDVAGAAAVAGFSQVDVDRLESLAAGGSK